MSSNKPPDRRKAIILYRLSLFSCCIEFYVHKSRSDVEPSALSLPRSASGRHCENVEVGWRRCRCSGS